MGEMTDHPDTGRTGIGQLFPHPLQLRAQVDAAGFFARPKDRRKAPRIRSICARVRAPPRSKATTVAIRSRQPASGTASTPIGADARSRARTNRRPLGKRTAGIGNAHGIGVAGLPARPREKVAPASALRVQACGHYPRQPSRPARSHAPNSTGRPTARRQRTRKLPLWGRMPSPSARAVAETEGFEPSIQFPV